MQKNIIRLLLLPMFIFAYQVNAQNINKQQIKEDLRIGFDLTRKNNLSSIIESIRYFEPYVALLGSPSERKIAESINDPWPVLWSLSGAYSVSNSYKEKEFATFVRNYYEENGKKDFPQYYAVMEWVFKFDFQRGNKDEMKSIADYLYDEALAQNDQSLALTSCQYLKATVAGAQNDIQLYSEWLKKAYQSGKKFEKEGRGSLLFGNYLYIMNSLIQLYNLQGNHERAYELVEEMTSLIKEAIGHNSQQYIIALYSKIDVLFAIGKVKEIETTLSEIESLLKVVDNPNEMLVTQIKNNIALCRSRIAGVAPDEARSEGTNPINVKMQTAAASMASGEFESAIRLYEDVIMEIKSNPYPLTLDAYNGCIGSILQMKSRLGKYDECINLLQQAEDYVSKTYTFDPYATRFLHHLFGMVYERMADHSKAKQYIELAKQQYECSGDHGINYYMNVLTTLADVYYATNDVANYKLTLDNIYRYVKEQAELNQIQNNSQTLMLIAGISGMYISLGYKMESEELFNQIFPFVLNESNGGIRRAIACSYIAQQEYEKAEMLLEKTVQEGDNDRNEIEKALMGLFCIAYKQKSETLGLRLNQYDEFLQKNLRESLKQDINGLQKQIIWETSINYLSKGYGLALSLQKDNPDINQKAYNTTLLSKGTMGESFDLSWIDVQQMLSDHDVAIEYVTLPIDDNDDVEFTYAALIVKKDSKYPLCIPLCNSREIDDVWHNTLHTDTAMINKIYSVTDTYVYDRLWKKMEPYFQLGDTIYYSPIKSVSRYNMEFIGNGTVQLNDRYTIRQLSSTMQIANVKRIRQLQGKTATLFGGLDYSLSVDEMKDISQKYIRQKVEKQIPIEMGYLTRGAINDMLDGTLEEVEQLEEELKSQGYTTISYTGAE